MIVIGISFLIIVIGAFVEFNRREKDNERNYNLYFGRGYKTNKELKRAYDREA